jgi:glycosyltransferase involved in cell wall biosynthesis
MEMRLAIAQRLTMAHGIRGGMETQAQSLATGLVAWGHRLVVLTTPHPDGRQEGMEETVPVRYLAPGTYRGYQQRWWEACYHELEQMHRSEPLNVLLSQSAGALGYLPRAVADLRLPVVVIVHGSMSGELRTRLRSVASLRGTYRLARQLLVLPRLFLLWRKAAPMVHRWVVVSHETARDWQRELDIPSERIVVIPNGIDTTRFRPDAEKRQETRARLGILDDAPLLLAVGRLEQEKGFHVAIQALRQVRSRWPGVRLLIVGEGNYRRTLEQTATSLNSQPNAGTARGSTGNNNDAVIFAGYVPNAQLPDLLAAADLFLMPTLCTEAFPLTVVEAMAAGLPVVASNIGGIPTAITDGSTGLLVPTGHADTLARAVERLIQDEPLRRSLAAAAREAAHSRFSREQMVAATEHVLQQAIGNAS